MRRQLLVTLLVLPVFALLSGYGSCGEQPLVALYHDEGVWLDGLNATKQMLDWMDISWQEVNTQELNERGLEGFEIFWLPGGWALDYERKIRQAGREAILELIAEGGAYVGVCAGAYYAAATVVWEGERFPYLLKLFHGEAVGPEIYPWPHYGMAELEMNLEHPINGEQPQKEWMLLYGGGHFVPTEEQEMEIVAKYEQTGQPAIITFSYGQGKVLLLGIHPEIEENNDRDAIGFAKWLDDRGSDWPFMKAALNWLLGR